MMIFSQTILTLLFLFTGDDASARHRRYNGVIIVNQILNVKGTITDNGNAVPEFSGVKEGDVLETGVNSSAVVRIPGLGIFRMGEKTKVKLSKFSNRDHTKFELMNGDLLCLYKRLGDHEVQAPQSVTSPEGVAAQTFSVHSITETPVPPTKTHDEISLWDGKIEIKNPREASSQGLILTSTKAYKKAVAGPDGILEDTVNAGSPPDPKLLQDLESLYALP